MIPDDSSNPFERYVAYFSQNAINQFGDSILNKTIFNETALYFPEENNRNLEFCCFFLYYLIHYKRMEIEGNIIKFLQAGASAGWIKFFQIITMFGSFLGLAIAFVAIFIKNKRLAVMLVLTFAVASVANHFLKGIIARERPFEAFDYIHNYGNEDGFSMPSGHSMCAGLFATFLIYHLLCSSNNLWTKVFGSIALSSFACLIAFSRMVLGVHYLSDIVAGVFVGIIFAIIGIVLYNVAIKRIKSINKK